MDPVEPVPYKIVYADGSQGTVSKGRTERVEITYPNSDIYTGDIKEGLKDGQGVYSFINGDKYTGMWKNNLQHGIGKTEYAKGGKFYGCYACGKRDGEGVYNFINGDIYSGSWKNNLKHGKGTYIVNACKLEGNNYMKIVGTWERNEILKGKWLFPNGTFYEGVFEKNLPKNYGEWNFINENKNIGEYKHTQAKIGGTNEIGTKLSWCPEEEIFDPRIHKISG